MFKIKIINEIGEQHLFDGDLNKRKTIKICRDKMRDKLEEHHNPHEVAGYVFDENDLLVWQGRIIKIVKISHKVDFKL